MRGRFVVFEGIDGAGKSTQLARAADWLRARGREVVATHEPGGSPIGDALRALLLGHELPAEAELLLFLAERAAHVRAVIAPALARGAWVLCDRFTDSTRAYQLAGRGLDAPEQALAFAECGVRPDLVLWLDVPLAAAAARMRARGAQSRFDASERAFFARVRDAYAAIVARDPGRHRRVPADGAPEEVFAQVRAALEELGA